MNGVRHNPKYLLIPLQDLLCFCAGYFLLHNLLLQLMNTLTERGWAIIKICATASTQNLTFSLKTLREMDHNSSLVSPAFSFPNGPVICCLLNSTYISTGCFCTHLIFWKLFMHCSLELLQLVFTKHFCHFPTPASYLTAEGVALLVPLMHLCRSTLCHRKLTLSIVAVWKSCD